MPTIDGKKRHCQAEWVVYDMGPRARKVGGDGRGLWGKGSPDAGLDVVELCGDTLRMKIGVHQGLSPAGDERAAFAAVARALRAGAAAGAALVVFPELFLPGYNRPDLALLAQPRGGPWHLRLSDLARAAGCGLVIGYAERDGGDLFNSALALSASGAELAHYRKVQLYGPREKALFRPGDALVTLDLPRYRAGLLICYDVEFAPHVAALAARGANLILVPTANMLPFEHVSRVTVPAMAANHALSIVYANFCGIEGDLTYCGGSLIAGRDGSVVVQAGRGEALLVADLSGLKDIPAGQLSTQATDYRPLF